MSDQYIRTSADKETVNSPFADFGSGFVNAAIENPVNGVRQIVNRTGITNLPEFNIVDENKQPGFAGNAGQLAGGVAGFFAINAVGNRLMGDLGGKGVTGSVFRAGITGAVFDGVLRPSDENSSTFVRDRLTNGLVGGATFAGMAAGSRALDRTGLFAVPEARSLSGSIAYGAISGVAGGITHAQADAMFKQGKLLASVDQLTSDALHYGAFGAGFGALGYGVQRLSAGLRGGPHEVKSENGTSARVHTDAAGNVVKVETVAPSVNFPDLYEVKTVNVLKTTGDWSASARYRIPGDRLFLGQAEPYTLQNAFVQPDGKVNVVATNGLVRSFTPNGAFQQATIDGYLWGVRASAGENFSFQSNNGRTNVSGTQATRIDTRGRLTNHTEHDPKGGPIRMLDVRYDDAGAVSDLRFLQATMEKLPNGRSSSTQTGVLEFRQDGTGWKVGIDSTWPGKAWQGGIRLVPEANGKPAGFEFSPQNGKPVLFTPGSSTTTEVSNMIKATAK